MGRRVNVLTWMLMASCAVGLHAQCEMEEPRPSKAQKLYQRATQPKGKSSLADRIEWIEQALDLHPEDPEALMAAAELAFKSSRKNPEAWAMARVYASINPTSKASKSDADLLKKA